MIFVWVVCSPPTYTQLLVILCCHAEAMSVNTPNSTRKDLYFSDDDEVDGCSHA